MTDLNTFGGRFKTYRKSKKLTGEELGEILRVKKAQIAMIEKDSSKTNAVKLIELATAFPDLDLHWLLTGKGEMLLDPGHEKLKALLQSEQEELQAAKQELYLAMQELQSVKQGHQSAQQELESEKQMLRSEQEELQSVKQELQAVKQELQKEQEKVRAVRDKLDVERNKSEALEELLLKNQVAIPKYGGASRGR